MALTFGEIMEESVTALCCALCGEGLGAAQGSQGGAVLDLGSGEGRLLQAALEAYPFDVAHGIEIMSLRHQRALLRSCVVESKMRLQLADFRKVPWWHTPDLRVVFCVANLFDEDLMEEVHVGLGRCQAGVFLVLIGNKLCSGGGLLELRQMPIRTSWGDDWARIYHRYDSPLTEMD
ncbi:unnamed protein product [Polarella glacialis]|uniref:Uncharacterized protein n=1 Tax=Polarella glacialis TaxID=89957 RepID=A0A813D4C0_POLGL|nr:unnamed protein product [Polarella glacialis]